jgi:hypothetical protein
LFLIFFWPLALLIAFIGKGKPAAPVEPAAAPKIESPAPK